MLVIERSVYVPAKVELFVFCSAIISGSMVMCEAVINGESSACVPATATR